MSKNGMKHFVVRLALPGMFQGVTKWNVFFPQNSSGEFQGGSVVSTAKISVEVSKIIFTLYGVKLKRKVNCPLTMGMLTI
jgi:hypothetical protein